ncbi:hypothetical protein DWX41_11180 [Hungatella hathewayi]|uniref:Uncharacterized protein n=1 Tax=Hungatella hathewayi TaxID=154046 RepID=A0A3E2WWU5_9FIRM|nr:hypothetical protein [Faecalicatena contorta]RGC31786.1 hypothetical protein DWX41_11180 [Hungatella hathewayi]
MQDAKQNKGDKTKQKHAYYKIDHIAPPYDISIHLIICRLRHKYSNNFTVPGFYGEIIKFCIREEISRNYFKNQTAAKYRCSSGAHEK